MRCETCIFFNKVNDTFGTCDKHFTNKSPKESCTHWNDEIIGGMMEYNYKRTTGLANCGTCINSNSNMICGKFGRGVFEKCICDLWRRRKASFYDDDNFYLN